MDSGRFARVIFDSSACTVQIELDAANAFTSNALLRIEQPAKITGVGVVRPDRELTTLRGAIVIPLGSARVSIRLAPMN